MVHQIELQALQAPFLVKTFSILKLDIGADVTHEIAIVHAFDIDDEIDRAGFVGVDPDLGVAAIVDHFDPASVDGS